MRAMAHGLRAWDEPLPFGLTSAAWAFEWALWLIGLAPAINALNCCRGFECHDGTGGSRQRGTHLSSSVR
jgi:hypothetical protein